MEAKHDSLVRGSVVKAARVLARLRVGWSLMLNFIPLAAAFSGEGFLGAAKY
jgi:hypothetical protein